MDSENLQNILRVTGGDVFRIGLILAGGWLFVALTERLLPWLADKLPGRHRPYLLALVPVLRLLTIVAVIVLVIPIVIEPTFQNLVALLGALGLALGFAFKDYISSLVAGVIALYEMPYRPGDWIEIDGAYGEVKSIGMRAAEMVTPDDTAVVVPHLKLWNCLVHNANNGTQYLMCVTNFYLHPKHNAALVKNVLYDVALTSPFVQLKNPIIVVAQEKPWGTHYKLKAYPIDPRDQFNFITDLTIRGKDRLMAMNAEFVAVASTANGAAS